jgi:predicted adenylyl cyclase CyaB
MTKGIWAMQIQYFFVLSIIFMFIGDIILAATTKNHVEIELRYEILDQSQLPSFLAPLQKTKEACIVDIYFDTQNINLLKQGIYIRLRNNKKIDIKFNRECLKDPSLELQAYCEEYSFQLPLQTSDLDRFNSLVQELGLLPIDHADFDIFKEQNHLIEHRIVDKIRTSYSCNSFTIVIDEVANLGIFLEIELMANTLEFVTMVKKEMEQILMPLSLKPLQTGYDSLLLRKHNFKQYLQGRFILEEDKQYRISDRV